MEYLAGSGFATAIISTAFIIVLLGNDFPEIDTMAVGGISPY